MKKITLFFLSLIMALTLIPLSALSVSAANDSNGSEIFSYAEPGEKGRSIKIFKKDKSTSWYSQSSLTIEATEWVGNRQVTHTYRTKSYTTLSKTPLTAKEICQKDKNLRKADLFSLVENINAYSHIVNNPNMALISISYYYAQDYTNYGVNYLKNGTQGVLLSSSKKVLGIETPIYDLINDANDAHDFATMIKNNVWNMLLGIKAAGDKALNKDTTEYKAILNDYVDEFFSAMNGIS